MEFDELAEHLEDLAQLAEHEGFPQFAIDCRALLGFARRHPNTYAIRDVQIPAPDATGHP